MPGADLGVAGAAVASAIAFLVGGILITAALWRHPLVSPRGLKIRPDMSILRPCLMTALPNILQRFGVAMGFVAFGTMVNSIGQTATAAHTIANTVEQAFYIPGFGMQTAASTLIGNAYGAGDERLMKRYSSIFIPIEVGLMILSGGALFLTAPMLVDIFSNSPEVIHLGSYVLRMVAVSEPFYGFSIIVEAMMFGVGRTKAPFIYNITGMWCVRIVGTFICTQILGMGLISVWACMIAHNMVIFFIYLIVYIRGTWNPLSHSK
jgi:putative MATE family efflux protein